MSLTLISVSSCVALFVLMVLLAYAAHKVAKRKAQDKTHSSDVLPATTGSIFALLGLLLAFSFSGAFSRFDTRRQMIVDEVNSIGTAYSRIDVLAPEAQTTLRKLFAEYTASRASLYDLFENRSAAITELNHSLALQNDIWREAVTATNMLDYQGTRMLILPAINFMMDIANTRVVAAQIHPPLLVFSVLFAVALCCAAIVGYSANTKQPLSKVHITVFAGVTAFMIYVVLDVEFARYGLVNLREMNETLSLLAESMKAQTKI